MAPEAEHAGAQPGQAGALARVRAAHPVVGDPDQHPVRVDGPVDHDLDAVGAAVLGDVRQGLGDHEVDGGLHVRGQAPDGVVVQAPVDRDLGAGEELLDRRAEAAVDQQGRRDAARERAELLDGVPGLLVGGVQGRAGAVGVAVHRLAGPPEIHRQAHQPLLRPVVDVALEAPQGARLGLAGGVASTGGAEHLVLQVGAPAEEHQGRGGVRAGRGAGQERQQAEDEDAREGGEQDRDGVVVRQADQRPRAVGEPPLPERVAGAAQGDGPGGEGEDRGEQAGHQADEDPQGVQPDLLVAQGREEASVPGLGRVGAHVDRGGRGFAQLGPDPPPFQAREAAGDAAGGDEQGQPDEQPEQRRARAHEHEHREGRGEHEGEGEQGVPGVREQPAHPVAHPGGTARRPCREAILRHVDEARSAAPGSASR